MSNYIEVHSLLDALEDMLHDDIPMGDVRQELIKRSRRDTIHQIQQLIYKLDWKSSETEPITVLVNGVEYYPSSRA